MWDQNNMLNIDRLSPDGCCLMERMAERMSVNSVAKVTHATLLCTLLEVQIDQLPAGDLPAESRKRLEQASMALRHYLRKGVSYGICLETLHELQPKLSASQEVPDPFERGNWNPVTAQALQGLEDGAGVVELALALLDSASGLEPIESASLEAMFDLKALGAVFPGIGKRQLAAFLPDDILNAEAFSERALAAIEQSMAFAAETGHQIVQPLHLLYALIIDREAFASTVLQRSQPGATVSVARQRLKSLLSRGPGTAVALQPMVRRSFSQPLQAALEDAVSRASVLSLGGAGEKPLLSALLGCGDSVMSNAIEKVLELPLQAMVSLARDLPESSEPEVLLPHELCESAELTRQNPKNILGREEIVCEILKVFCRKDCHNAALYGESGVGRTAVAWAVAAALKQKRLPALRNTPVIYLDLESIDEGALKDSMVKAFDFMDENPNRVFVLDHFGRFMRADTDLCRRRLKNNPWWLLAILHSEDREWLSKTKEDGSSFLHFIEVPELKPDVTVKIVESRLDDLAAEYGVRFDKGVAAAAVRMSGDYLISQKFPQKAFSLLTQAASDAAADSMLEGRADKPLISRATLAKQIYRLTGISVETILGTGQDKDFNYILSQGVVGQEIAVRKVADRLDLIQKSLVDRNRPQAIFMFVGLSGTGKTELAKEIAKVYSRSRKLISYAMADFTEKHSISRFIGSPPGYIGYEEGGKLINDMNRDPYSVVLFDEIEKAHPAIWDPFLNLFDEGVITDMKGVTAYGNKAFFVLTSNIGQYEIVRMVREKRPMLEIEEYVTQQVSDAVHAFTREKCFRPEFIGRIIRRGGIVVFNPLSQEAMTGITRHIAQKAEADFLAVHECRLDIGDDVIQHITQSAYEANERALTTGKDKYLGGRRIDTLFDAYVLSKLSRQVRQIAGAQMVRVVMDGKDSVIVPIYQEGDVHALLQARRSELVSRVESRLDRLQAVDYDRLLAAPDAQLARLDALLAEAGILSGV